MEFCELCSIRLHEKGQHELMPIPQREMDLCTQFNQTQVGNNHPKYISNMPREGHIGDFLNSFQQK